MDERLGRGKESGMSSKFHAAKQSEAKQSLVEQ